MYVVDKWFIQKFPYWVTIQWHCSLCCGMLMSKHAKWLTNSIHDIICISECSIRLQIISYMYIQLSQQSEYTCMHNGWDYWLYTIVTYMYTVDFVCILIDFCVKVLTSHHMTLIVVYTLCMSDFCTGHREVFYQFHHVPTSISEIFSYNLF